MSDGTSPTKPTVLVVDDEVPIQLLVRTVLEMHGHAVLTAGDAVEALRLSEEHREPIDMLITDVRLPGMSGTDLVRALLTARPNLRVLYISGSPGGESALAGVAIGTTKFLPKPFQARALLDMVRSLLAAR
jgi:two-component system cell cycle sensor histidine kinase/response regulator CckA